MTLTFLHCAQGRAVLIEGDGFAALVDAGPAASKGDADAAAFLKARGIRRLDLVVATQLDSGCLGGLPALLRELSVGEIWLPVWVRPGPGRFDGPHTADLRRAVGLAMKSHVPVLERRREEREVRGGLQFEVIAPEPALREELRAALDALEGGPDAEGGAAREEAFASLAAECSMVLRISDGRFSVLLPGGAEKTLDRLVWEQHPGLRASVLALPDRGVPSHRLLTAVGAKLAVARGGKPASGAAALVRERLGKDGLLLLDGASRAPEVFLGEDGTPCARPSG